MLLAKLKTLGVLPNFLTFHDYPQNPGEESDAALLGLSPTLAARDAASLRQILTDYLGAAASAKIELAMTELNSTGSNPGKQSVSLVDGLYHADVVASLARTEFNACTWWSTRDGAWNNFNNSSALYGWRLFGDFGLMAIGDRMDTPVNTPYPSFYAAKLLHAWAAGGDRVVSATTNYALLNVHAAMRANGHLACSWSTRTWPMTSQRSCR